MNPLEWIDGRFDGRGIIIKIFWHNLNHKQQSLLSVI